MMKKNLVQSHVSLECTIFNSSASLFLWFINLVHRFNCSENKKNSNFSEQTNPTHGFLFVRVSFMSRDISSARIPSSYICFIHPTNPTGALSSGLRRIRWIILFVSITLVLYSSFEPNPLLSITAFRYKIC